MKLQQGFFAFILSSVFSQYKDVVHVMPTKCLKAENLFAIVKHMIIDLEEIGFQVLSIITNNNVMHKKAISFFCTLTKFSIVYLHSVRKSMPFFFLFDSVHISKYIRINWFGQKDASKCRLFQKICHHRNHELDSIQSAPFCT